MCEAQQKIDELTARIAVLEAAVRTGNTKTPSKPVDESDYPFLAKLSDDDLIKARALIEENKQLREEVEKLRNTVEERDYRIEHLKRGIDKLLPK
ncbi:hypothetical protein GPJ56_000631 [Histomonas meleagridis]|uniref:uncharacterized protein n=1 Tax=Histomonas meleagridis TaxID=135588 RepID=UPI00355ACAB9|nr:hypothetical protein GPJ56_000631 [Histomonas meleagridis]KAH0804758.1 hypothetical protein GO595_002452 [Histomonas meleagridis]